MIEETVLREHRAQWSNLAARVPFTPSDDQVFDSRKHLEDSIYLEVRQQEAQTEKIRSSAKALQTSADTFDVG